MTNSKKPFSKNILHISNTKLLCEKIIEKLKHNVLFNLARRGAIVGISGGIDSSVTLALASKAFGPDRVLGVLLPEKDSSPESKDLAMELADRFKVKTVVEDITGALEGFGCYQRRDRAVKNVFENYDPNVHKFKIGIKQNSLHSNMPPSFSVTILHDDGSEESRLLPLKEYLQIVASSNFKQRSRMSMLYYHAERLHYAVVGTPNKHEVEQGFFVKYGDGGADVMPIAQLYKTQVYQIAKYLDVPKGIINRVPTTDTYAAEQTQEEFFFRVPFDILDRVWFGWEQGRPSKQSAEAIELTEENVESILHDTQRKIRTTEYLRMEPL